MNTKEYDYIKTLEDAKKIIAEQDMIIGHQFRQISDLKDSWSRYTEAKDRRIREAGYPLDTSFDIVWAETLKKAQS